MAKNMMNCPDCGREISKDAASCPGCGKRIKGSGLEGVASDGGTALGVIIAVAIPIGLLVWVGTSVASCIGL